jgi:threonine-phosphate decarboxylase
MIDDLPIHGGQLRQIGERFGVPASELLDFSANINPDGPPPAVVAALRASLDDPGTLTRYPDLQQPELKQAIARLADVTPENVALANGFVPLLEAALGSLPIRNCVLPVPAFNEYRRTLERYRIAITPHVLTPESNFHYDIDAMLSGQPDAILLANPQNPSGVICERTHMMDLLARAAERNTYVLLDEAFIDYEPQQSLASEIDRFPNLIVFRSITKFYAIPGLRVAYAMACSSLIRRIDARLAPWTVTTLAARGALAASQDQAYALQTRERNYLRKAHLRKELEALGLHPYPSAANFLLFRLRSSRAPGILWQTLIVEHHILLRCCENYEGLPSFHFRAAVRDEESNGRLVRALASFSMP